MKGGFKWLRNIDLIHNQLTNRLRSHSPFKKLQPKFKAKPKNPHVPKNKKLHRKLVFQKIIKKKLSEIIDFSPFF
jgi:hypothetical protein